MATFPVKDGQKFLFIGDSITDCGRRAAERPYGSGYVSLFIELQRAWFPERKITYVNMGIGGHTVLDLRNRWSDDVLREKPDWLSIKIGINDCHRFLNGQAPAQSPEKFREDYDAILAATQKTLGCPVILIDPFYISTDQTGLGSRSQVLKLLPRYIEVVHDMAKKYKTRLVRTHDMYQKHLKFVGPDFFCPEPVHPFRSGHLFMALEVMKALGVDVK